MSGRITAIEPHARHANRFDLYVDDQLVASLSAAIAAQVRLGQVLSDDELAALELEEAFESAHKKALRFLEPRPRSTAEVKGHLFKKKFAPEVIHQVIVRLTQAGLLDDGAFAKYWVENREEFRPRAAHALRYELKRKGLAPDVIADALGGIDEHASAYRAGAARAQRWRDLEHREFREKMGAFLVRRGFSYDVAKDAAERLWSQIVTGDT